MRIIAIRHPETEGDKQHLVQSRTDSVLSEEGRLHAEEIAYDLDATLFDAAYSSDLQHCIDTARTVLQYHSSLELRLTKKLRERDPGIYEGKHWEDVPWFGCEADNLVTEIPEGESWLMVRQRVGGFINKLYKQDQNANVLLVTHDGPIKVLRALLGTMSLRESVDLPIGSGSDWPWDMSRPVLYEAV